MTAITTVVRHVRVNAVAYLALFVALGGTSVAAIDLANHSVTPEKLSLAQFGGYVRAWASVAASGRVVAAGGRATVKMQAGLPGDYIVAWHTRPGERCTALADVDARGVGSGPAPGYAAPIETGGESRAETFVHTYSPTGEPTPLPFDVALLCSTPR